MSASSRMFPSQDRRIVARPSRPWLLAGASVATMLLATGSASARALNGGSAGFASAPTVASDAATQAAAQAALAARKTQDSLARAAKAVQDMQATQAAARAAAAARQTSLTAPVTVPNGLGAGGLLPNAPAGWTGAATPTQSVDGTGQTQVGIKQTTSSAILNWNSFNIGARTTLTFDQQGHANWVALNRVDASTGPSQILGNIKADGQVYVINQSGIIFGGASQINVGSLIASTAGITDVQFNSNGIYSAQNGTSYVPSFTAAGGKVVVEAGAAINTSAPSSVTSGGGFVLLLGSQVENAGSIGTPKGQALLAAGDDFIIRPGVGTQANTTSTTRGSEVAPVIRTAGYGSVSNSGLIFAQQGDITLAGRSIAQNGALIATTSVNTRGTIHLLNSASDSNGSITLGAASLTSVLPELASTEAALDSQRDALIAASTVANLARAGSATGAFDNLSLLADRQDQSRVEIVTGGSVTFKGGSYTSAQGGQIAVSATRRIVAEDGATLDASGLRNVALAMASNNVLINVQGNELRDSPQNRDSDVLKSNDVWIDVRSLTLVPAGTGGYASDRYYTAGGLLEVGGYLGTTAHTIGEWAAVGGSITLSAPEVIAQKGATFDISGGSLDYAAGWIRSTNLIGSDGRRYSVDNAPADMTFVSFAGGFSRTHNIQGKQDDRLTETWTTIFDRGRTSLRWEDAYTVGRDAGRLILSTPTSVFEGTILADTVSGDRQITKRTAAATDGYKQTQTTVAQNGTLALGQYDGRGLVGGADSDVVFGRIEDITAGRDAETASFTERKNTAWFDAGLLNKAKLGGIDIVSKRSITVDAALMLDRGGQIDFIAPTISIKGDITAHGGTANLGNVMPVVTNAGQPASWQVMTDAQGNSRVTIHSGSTIDLSGLWVNQRDGSTPDASRLGFLDGGTLNAAATGSVTFAAGSIIDVSSGAALLINGKSKLGKGGDVSLIANDDSRYRDLNATIDPSAPLVVEGKIIAYGFSGGGSLTLRAGQTVVIGDDASLTGGTLAAGTAAGTGVRLNSDVVIPVGGKMPFDYSVVSSVTPVDRPLTTALSPPASGLAVRTAASWVVPAGMNVRANGSSVSAGGTVPPGALIDSISKIPVGTVIPSSVFPNGIPVTAYLLASYKTGDVVTSAVTLPKGMVVPVGAQFDTSIAIQPVLSLRPDLFSTGFRSYAVSSNTGLEITADIAATVPVYRPSAASYAAPTGSKIVDVADLWLPPTYIADSVAGDLTQRAGASLTFSSLYDFNMARGSAITVDPLQHVTIYANRQTTIDGAITAHGGNILVASVPDAPNGASYGDGYGFLTPTRSIWIGEGSALDVSAQAVVANDMRGHRFGTVPTGGSITLGGSGDVASDAFVIVRPGALLDASGTAGTIDVWSAAGYRPTSVASDGGTIALYSASGIYLDGDLRAAAGGAGASGGLLSINMLSHSYDTTLPTAALPFAVGAIPTTVQKLRNITIVQHDQGSVLPADLAPGQGDASLTFGPAVISVDKVHAGGFDQLALNTHDLFVFSGNVDLAMNRSITLAGGVITAGAADPHSTVHLAAPYVKLDGWYTDPSVAIVSNEKYYSGLNTIKGPSLNTATDSSFTVDADLIDVSSAVQFGVHAHQGSGNITYVDAAHPVPAQDPTNDNDTSKLSGPHIVDAPGFTNVTLNSSGDVRFGTGGLTASQHLTITAAQIYPLSGATTTITAGQMLPLNEFGGIGSVTFDPQGSIAIKSNGGAAEVPASVFGNLALIAPTIDQGGVVRAPLGVIAFNNLFGSNGNMPTTTAVTFRNGSLTSTSADGLAIPYGGTSDGVSYVGASGAIQNLGSMVVTVNGVSRVETGLMISGQTVVGEAGAILDVSGGGNLTGAGFVSGRGGSVNVLTTALVNANPANSFSAAGNKVYAIVPGYASAYAPVIASNGAGDPAIGQQVTVPAGVPGLAAGTYTLLPSSYALMPGAFRVELGKATTAITAPLSLANGSVVTTGYLGTANTAVRSALPTSLILTSGKTVRTYSQYNETSYADFLRNQASLFDGIRPRLPADGGILQFNLGIPSSGKALSFAGTALFGGADDGVAGTLNLQTASSTGFIDITAPGRAPIAGHVTVSSDDINAFNAATLVVGGVSMYDNDTNDKTGGRIYFSGASTVNVLDGATLRAGQIFLVGPTLNIGAGATLDTRGLGSNGVDSTLGYAYGNIRSETGNSAAAPAVLAVANGWFDFLPFVGSGSITIASGASLLTEGSIVLGAPGTLAIGDVNLGARYLAVTQTTVNVGTDASLAAAQASGHLPAGWNLTQSVLDRLLHPSATAGVPALEQLTIVAGGSVNFIGDVALDVRGNSANNVQFVVNTPALYGLGGANDSAHLTADTFVWNGIRTGNGLDPNQSAGAVPYGSKAPTAIVANGPGTGLGSLEIAAQTVLFGYGEHGRITDGVSLNRYAIGFANVNVSADSQVTTNSDGTLFVGLSRDGSGVVHGGNLTITSPLLTAQQGAVMGFTAGGAITVVAPASGVANPANVTTLGGTLAFTGDSIALDTAVALPSGKLTLNAVNDVIIGNHAVIDLSGRTLVYYDQPAYSWGGDVVLQSANGNISQAAGSLIDVSAQNNAAGTISASATDATHGVVALSGALKGSSGGAYTGGSIIIAAQDLGDFAALNVKLNNAGFFNLRSFDIKRGDLVIGSGVKANTVSISVDGGSLTVNGTIDASGDRPGTIRLAARKDLTLAASAVLDVHGNRLKKDSYGAAIDADNTGTIELTAVTGFVNLNGGATIDMRSADAVARGKLEINAPRLGANDIAINAGDALNIAGAKDIAVNGFRTYSLPDGGTIDQAYLATLDSDSTAFINAALANSALQTRLDGLSVPGATVHVRPGVEITSTGALATAGDLDFADYRYGPNAEPGKLVIRAAGDLKINGSITDGFGTPPNTPDGNGAIVVVPGGVATQTVYLNDNVTLAEDWVVPSTPLYTTGTFIAFDSAGNEYDPGMTIPAGTTLDLSNFGPGSFGWEAGVTIPALLVAGAPQPVYALAQPLAAGSLSWSMRLVSGADIAAADSRALRSVAALAGAGNMTLSNPHAAGSDKKPVASVIRTGTGDLDLLAGGNFSQTSPYGIYTAGTSISPDAAYNLERGKLADGSVLGDVYAGYKDTLGPQYMYYMERGGNLLLKAQGNIDGNLAFDSTQVGGWLWRQGGAELGQSTAWGINFGSYTSTPATDGSGLVLHLSTFSGIGTLGGGNVSVQAGGDIGDKGGIVIAIGGSGRVDGNGNPTQTGGGTLSVTAGGNIGGGGNQFVNLRGDTSIVTGDFGTVYGSNFGYNGATDPRPVDTFKAYAVTASAGGSFVPGDGAISIRARGDIAMGDVLDPGRVGVTQQTGAGQGRQAATWFTLWTANTALDIFGAGGTVSPLSANQGSISSNGASSNTTLFLPSILRVTAGNGDIYLSPGKDGASLMLPSPTGDLQLLAAGSIIQDVDLLYAIGELTSAPASLATPLHPGWAQFSTNSVSSTLMASNSWNGLNMPSDGVATWKAYSYGYGSDTGGFGGLGGNPFVFGPNTMSDASAFGGSTPAKIYAAGGDILNLVYGQLYVDRKQSGSDYRYTNYYRAAKPVDILACGDIVDLQGLIAHNDPADVSVIAASGSVVYAGVNVRDDATQLMTAGLKVAGPGTLEISAGKNIYQGAVASIESIGPLIPGDSRLGAGIVMQAGVGAGTAGVGQIDWSGFAKLYLDPANLAGGGPLADQSGKVARTYDGELYAWLKDRFGYAGTQQGALAYFNTLASAQQRVFLRQVYYAELTAGGREYNDASSARFHSYLRGREAIAALFPADSYAGDITMFSAKAVNSTTVNSGFVHTDFGGDIQFLAPGGQVTIGTEGLAPGADAGLITQGTGNIQIYSEGSVLLGLSRVMTTFGGNILMWSASGDINAGRGSKTTVLYTPPKRTYDRYGNVALAPQVPSSGAGIATLNPIPDVPPGDIDLIAPLGVIDAGEAGIRVSGNVNLAALQVLNAANISVQGTSSGIPTVQAPSITAALSTSNATAATQQTATPNQGSGNERPSVIIVEVLGYGGGNGSSNPGEDDDKQRQKRRESNYNANSALQMVGNGRLTEQQQQALTSEERSELEKQ